MSDTPLKVPSTAVIHRLLSPAFTLPTLEVWNETLIPATEGTSFMQRLWRNPTFGPRPLNLAVLENVTVIGNGMVFDAQMNRYEFDCEAHSAHDVNAAIARLRDGAPAARHAGSLVLCKKPGAGNYGHWLMEMLPRAYLARKILPGPQRYIVPRAAGGLASAISISLALLGFAPDEIVLADDAPQHVERLIVVEGLTCHGAYMSPLVFECIDALRTQIAPSGPPRIYVTRETASPRSFTNADAVEAAAEQAGFRALDPGNIAFARQIARFANARTIVGIMGAAMTNIAFAPRGATIYNCAPASMPDTFFWFIAGHRGHRYVEVRCPQQASTGIQEWDAGITLQEADANRIFSKL